MALLAAAGWALSCVIDVFFVGDGVYREPADGPLIMGLFCVIPLLATLGTIDWQEADSGATAVAALAGICYLLHVYFYFKALFLLNDATNAEIFNTLSVLIIPLFAFVLLGEKLAWINYAAIGLATAGILVLARLQMARLSRFVIAQLVASMIFVALATVLQAWVLQHVSYGTAVGLFSMSAFVAVVVVLAIRPCRRRHVAGLCRRFGVVFACVQLLELSAVFCSQRATDVGPSVSLVALIECALPLFVMAFSWLLGNALRFLADFESVSAKSSLALQTGAAPSKLTSMLLILTAILLVQ